MPASLSGEHCFAQALRPQMSPSARTHRLKCRVYCREVVTATGLTLRIVPHQFRHTYVTEMVRAGVSFAAVIVHKSPHMTIGYLEITQQDLQREFHLARSHPRHLTPSRTPSGGSQPRADLASVIDSLKKHAAGS
jgi:site-specific recombinase XerD